MRHWVTAVALILLTSAAAQDVLGQDRTTERKRLAQTGMKFLSVSVHARAAALADAMTAQEASSVAMFYNPAGMARMDRTFDVALGQTQWLAGTRYDMASAAFRPANGSYGVFGLSVVAVDYGKNFLGTIRADNEKGFIDLGGYAPSAMAVGLGYARALTDRFSVGANLKYARQSLGESTLGFTEGGDMIQEDFAKGTVAVDFGVLLRTGLRSLNFAVSARNFSRELTYAEENFELPLTFRMGVSADVLDFAGFESSTHTVMLALEAERPRDFSEQVRVGMEYAFMNMLALRAGYVYPTDEQGLNLGAGVQTDLGGIALGADYAYTQFGAFGSVNRLAIQFGF